MRKRIHDYYCERLTSLEEAGIFRLPRIPSYCTSNYHIFYLIFSSGEKRDQYMKELKQEGIETTFHYVPLHTSPCAKKRLKTSEGMFPITEDMSKRLLRLPIYPDLGLDKQRYICKKIYDRH